MKWMIGSAAAIALAGSTANAQSGRNDLPSATIYFQQHSAEILPTAQRLIDTLANQLNGNPDTKIEIKGHTDTNGDEMANGALSIAMAYAVAAKLIRAGVDPQRIEVAGYGETQLAYSTPDDTSEPLNRRVEVKAVPRQS